MLSRLAVLILICGIAPAGVGQEEASEKARNKAKEITSEIQAYTSKWSADARKAAAEYAAKAKKAEAEGKDLPMRPAMRMVPDYRPFVKKILACADEAKGEDQARFLSQAVMYARSPGGTLSDEIFDRLLRDHPRSSAWKQLGRLIQRMNRSPERTAEIFEILVKHPHAEVRGWVALAQHGETIEDAATDSSEYQAAKKALLAAAKNVENQRLRNEITGPIDLREKFGPGATAPDIVGVDLDGVEFKLSDYKGKVIFLDFWGDW